MAIEYDGRRPRIPAELAQRIDGVRGQVPFNRWVVGALKLAVRRETPALGLKFDEALEAVEPKPGACWDCGHEVSSHSGFYPGWDLRGVPREEWPAKKRGEGCLVAGCECRRAFEVTPARPVRKPA